MSTPENPPAFPAAITVAASGDVYHGFDGMSLRDWFAGQVLAGHPQSTLFSDPPALARHVYRIADALLAERENRGREA